MSTNLANIKKICLLKKILIYWGQYTWKTNKRKTWNASIGLGSIKNWHNTVLKKAVITDNNYVLFLISSLLKTLQHFYILKATATLLSGVRTTWNI